MQQLVILCSLNRRGCVSTCVSENLMWARVIGFPLCVNACESAYCVQVWERVLQERSVILRKQDSVTDENPFSHKQQHFCHFGYIKILLQIYTEIPPVVYLFFRNRIIYVSCQNMSHKTTFVLYWHSLSISCCSFCRNMHKSTSYCLNSWFPSSFLKHASNAQFPSSVAHCEMVSQFWFELVWCVTQQHNPSEENHTVYAQRRKPLKNNGCFLHMLFFLQLHVDIRLQKFKLAIVNEKYRKLDCLLQQCECMLTDKHLKSVFGQGGYCAVPFMRPHFMFGFFSLSLHNMDVFFSPITVLPLCTRTTTIQPVHSGGCHSNRAASLSPSFVQCLPIVWASQAKGGVDSACKLNP